MVANAYPDSTERGRPGPAVAHPEPPGLRPPPPIPISRLRGVVRALRVEKGLSINDVMMRSGLSRTATLDLLNGRGRIACGRLDSWWALAWALEVPLSQLVAALDDAVGSGDGGRAASADAGPQPGV